jgi:SsrA-binding protein
MDKPERFKILTDNRRARHEYFLSDHLEAGMVLSGTEVKSIKDGGMQLSDAYGLIENNELWLFNAHISHYGHGNIHNHEPGRKRKLLIHRKEIDKLIGKTREKGLTLIPTKIYLKNGRVKCELAVGKGKKFYDKRETLRKRQAEDEAKSAMRERARGRE